MALSKCLKTNKHEHQAGVCSQFDGRREKEEMFFFLVKLLLDEIKHESLFRAMFCIYHNIFIVNLEKRKKYDLFKLKKIEVDGICVK